MADAAKGLFFRSRLTHTLSKNLKASVWKALSTFISAYNDDQSVIDAALKPFSAFRREPENTKYSDDPNRIVSAIQNIFSLQKLNQYLQDITWNSNVLDLTWNPKFVTGISTSNPSDEFILWDGSKLTVNTPYRFRRWVQKVVQPHKDPMALLLHVLKQMGAIDASLFYKYDSVDYVLSRKLTPR